MARGSRGPKALRKAVLSVLYSRIFFCTTRLMHGWHESTQTSLGAGMRMTGWYIVEQNAGGYSSGDQPNSSRLVELLWSLYFVSFATDMALRQRHIGCVGHAKVQALQGCEDTGWPID